MSLNCGIVGLPNVGKSTLFAALTSQSVPMENYPFCTIEPNRGIVRVPDQRLELLASYVNTKETIPAVVEFVDIAGLVEGASKGEGLGNQFLAHIREVGIIVHIVRCFHDEDVAHVSGRVDPASDIEIVQTELALSDLETVEKRIEKNQRFIRSDDKEVAKLAKSLDPLLERLKSALSECRPVRSLQLDTGEAEMVSELHLLTMKPQLYICNVDEDGLVSDNELVTTVEQRAESEGAGCLRLCTKLEAEIAMLESAQERVEFLESAGLDESGLDRLVKTAYQQLGLRTFFTENGKEARAWTFELGESAPRAAGRIHTDFERGFIKAEVYSIGDLSDLGGVHEIKQAGKLRIEGRDYAVRDGDVILFRFNANG